MPFCLSTNRYTASGAPLRIDKPEGRSTPLIRVCALKAINSGIRGDVHQAGISPLLFEELTMLLPSGVSSAVDANAARRPTSSAE